MQRRDFLAGAATLVAPSAREWAGPSAREYRDFRKLLEPRDVGAVLVATPDHWHAAIAAGLRSTTVRHLNEPEASRWLGREPRPAWDPLRSS